jgi:hypothetical protein
LYKIAYNFLGKNAVIDIVAICGYYNLISMTLNDFNVPGESSEWILPEVKNLKKMLP